MIANDDKRRDIPVHLDPGIPSYSQTLWKLFEKQIAWSMVGQTYGQRLAVSPWIPGGSDLDLVVPAMPVTYRITMPYTGDISVNRYLAKSKVGGQYTRETAAIWGMCLRGAINYLLPKGYDPTQLSEKNPFDFHIAIKFPRKFSKRSGDPPNFDKFPRDIVAAALGVDDVGTKGKLPTGTYGHGIDNSCFIITVVLHPAKEHAKNFKDELLCLL
jgi:hypothetical protein